MRKTLLLILPLILFSFSSGAREYYFQHYNSSDGLCHQTIRCAVQDEKGFLWFGTKAGLSRYDGYRFINYYHQNGKQHSLPDNSITCIASGINGEIWVGTNSGLAWFAPEHENFYQFSDTNGSLIYAKHLHFDPMGRLWAFCNDVVHIIDPGDKEIISTLSYEEEYVPVSSEGGDVLWLSTGSGYIVSIDETGNKKQSFKVLTDEEVAKRVVITSVHAKSDGDLLVFTNNSGVRQVCVHTSEVTTLHDNSPLEKNEYIFVTMRYSDNEIWAGTETGIYIFDISKSEYTVHLTKSYTDNHSLSDNAIHVFLKDRENGVWCGSFFNGLNYLPNDVNQFKTLFPTDNEGEKVANVIRDIVPMGNGLMIGTEDGGLFRLYPNNSSFLPMNLDWGDESAPSNVQSLLMVDDGTLWVGSFDTGIFVFDLKSGKVTNRYNRDRPETGIPNIIVCLFKTSRGDILAGTHLGLYLFDKDAQHFSKVKGTNAMVKDISEDSDGIVWISTQGNGLLSVSSKTLSKESVLQRCSFPNDLVTSVFEDSSHNFYICTEAEGAYTYDRKEGSFTPVINPEEYPGVIAYQMIEDHAGNIWISSSIGLFKYDGSTGIESLYSTSNGLLTNQFNYNSSYEAPDGTLFFGSVMGLVSFDPAVFGDNDVDLNVFITTIKTPNIVSSNPVKCGSIKLRHGENNLSISYAVPSYSSSNQIWYRYKLDGIDAGWATTLKPNDLQYSGLSAGSYHFVVEASADRSNWVTSANYDITVLRPFWRSILALIFYFLIALSWIYTLIKAKIEKQRRDEKYRMEVLKADKEKEAMASMVNFFTNITHEIRTPLTIISGSLERIKKGDMCKTSLEKDLQIMSKHTHRLHDLVNQILDFRKLESSSTHLSFEKVNFEDQVKEHFNVFSPLAKSKNIKYFLNIEKGDYWTMADKDALTKILSNLLSNALKFCESKVTVSLETDNSGDGTTYVVKVENDGEILPNSAANEIFKPFYQYKSSNNLSTGSGLGLPLAKSLAELMDGQLYYDCADGRQTNIFVFKIPATTPVEEAKDIVKEESVSQVEDIIHFIETGTESHDRSGYTILVVDDEEDMRHLLYEELSTSYNVLTAENGKKALEILDKNIISLIISDIMMPVMDGLEFCKEVKCNVKYSHIPIVMLTAKVSMQSHIDALDSKADAFIEKPFSHDHLMAMISNLLTNRELIHSTFIHSPYAHMSSVTYNKIDEKFLDRLNAFIMENLSDKDLSVEVMAEQMNMSISSFYRKVKLTTSLSPIEFVRLCRLKKAAELLSSGKYRINEVSDKVGFSSQSRFASYFMRQFGITPSQFVKDLDK